LIEYLKIRLVRKFEIEYVLLFLKEAAVWLESKGIDYWQNWQSPEKIYKEWIQEGLDNNEFYFVQKDLVPIGMFRLQWNDELFWGKQEDNAGYIHSFTTDRRYYGKEIGKHILRIIEEMCRDNKKKYLRLDCGVAIHGLCEYYEKYGFKSVGEVEVGGELLRLYEKEI